MVIKIRDATPADQIYIQDTDIKCFDLAWSSDAWGYAGEHYVIKLATWFGTPISFATYLHDTENNVVQFPKLAVKSSFRNRGLGRRMTEEAIAFCRQLGATHIQTIVPEAICRPGEAGDISGFLTKTGWKATGLVRDFFPSMGQRQDGVQFILNPY